MDLSESGSSPAGPGGSRDCSAGRWTGSALALATLATGRTTTARRRLLGASLSSSVTSGSRRGPEWGPRKRPSRIVVVRRSLAGSMWFLPRGPQRRLLVLALVLALLLVLLVLLALLLWTDLPCCRRQRPAAFWHRGRAARGCWTRPSACPRGRTSFFALSPAEEASPPLSRPALLPEAWQREACSGIVMAVADRCWDLGIGRTPLCVGVVLPCRIGSSALSGSSRRGYAVCCVVCPLASDLPAACQRQRQSQSHNPAVDLLPKHGDPGF